MKTILLAFRKDGLEWVLRIFRDTAYPLAVLDSVGQAIPPDRQIDIAFVDEDFDGADSGWLLAARLRELGPSIKIVMIVHRGFKSYQGNRYKPYHDWLMIYATLSAEEILGEIERPWKPQQRFSAGGEPSGSGADENGSDGNF